MSSEEMMSSKLIPQPRRTDSMCLDLLLRLVNVGFWPKSRQSVSEFKFGHLPGLFFTLPQNLETKTPEIRHETPMRPMGGDT